MKYAKRLRNLALITMPWMLLQFGCALSSDEVATLTANGIRDMLTAFFKTAVGNVLDAAI
ncbi:MAG: hypothetical protein JSU68_12365 [Phycisphaerales bacterium]|nr:MAG: hypothetical protein JSU68_12365 [Phycisphaerales bacterium]